MQTGTVSRLRFRKRSWRFKIHFWRNIVSFWKSYICSNKLVCARNKLLFRHSSTESENHLFGRWIEIGRDSRSRFLFYETWLRPQRERCDLLSLTEVLETRLTTVENRETCWWTNVRFVQHLTRFTNASNPQRVINDLDNVDFLPHTCTLLVKKFCSLCLKTTKQWSRWL